MASTEGTARATYAPETRTWRALSTVNEPPGGRQPTVAWTGTRLVAWGGGTRTGGLYDPAPDSWETIALDGAPSARIGHSLVCANTYSMTPTGVLTEGPLTCNAATLGLKIWTGAATGAPTEPTNPTTGFAKGWYSTVECGGTSTSPSWECVVKN